VKNDEYANMVQDTLSQMMGDVVYNRAVRLFEEVLSQGYDMIICLSRSCYNLYKALRPRLTEYSDEFHKVTHDKMILPWLNLYAYGDAEKTRRIAIIDDETFRGQGCVECIDKLRRFYGLECADFIVHALYVREQENGFAQDAPLRIKEKKICVVKQNENEEDCSDPLQVDLRYADTQYYTDAFLRDSSLAKIKAFYAIGQAYVAYMPSFTLPLDSLIGDERFFCHTPVRDSLIQKDSLSEKFCHWDFCSITTNALSDAGVDAVALFPPEGELDGQPDKDIEQKSALRIYVNYTMKSATIVPYVSLLGYFPGKIDSSLLPSPIAKLTKKPNDQAASDTQDSNFFYSQSLNRLLRYSSGYYICADFLSRIGIDAVDAHNALSARAGIGGAVDFYALLAEGDSKWLLPIWKTLSTNICKEGQYEEQEKLAGIFERHSEYYKKDDKSLFVCVSNAWEEFTRMRIEETLGKSRTRPKDEQYGIPLSVLHGVINATFGAITDAEFYSLVFKLCDYGRGVTQVAYLSNAIETVIRHGETLFQACQSIDAGYAYGLTLAQRLPNDYLEMYYNCARRYAESADTVSDRLRMMINSEIGKKLGIARSRNSSHEIPDDDFFLQLALSLQSCYSAAVNANGYVSFVGEREVAEAFPKTILRKKTLIKL
jgi:hypothetical protein